MDRIEGTELVVPARGSTPAGSRRRSLARRGRPTPRLLAAAPAPRPPSGGGGCGTPQRQGRGPKGRRPQQWGLGWLAASAASGPRRASEGAARGGGDGPATRRGGGQGDPRSGQGGVQQWPRARQEAAAPNCSHTGGRDGAGTQSMLLHRDFS